MDDVSRGLNKGDQSDKLDGSYAWCRLVASLMIGTVGGIGMWSSVILIPEIQGHFEVDRSDASLPYTVAMIGIMIGNILMGRMVDKFCLLYTSPSPRDQA